jgi:hypothetical protein
MSHFYNETQKNEIPETALVAMELTAQLTKEKGIQK